MCLFLFEQYMDGICLKAFDHFPSNGLESVVVGVWVTRGGLGISRDNRRLIRFRLGL